VVVTAAGTRSRSVFVSVAGTTLFIQLCTLLSGPLLARMLGPAGRGEMAMVLAIVVLCSLPAAGGLPSAIARAVGESGNPARDVVHRVLPGWLLWSLVPTALSAGLTVVLFRDRPDLVPLAIWSTVLTWQWSFQYVLSAMLRGEGDLRKVNAQRTIGMVLYVIAVAIAFVAWPGIHAYDVLALNAVFFPVMFVCGWRWLRRPTGDPALRVDPAELRRTGRSNFLGTIGGGDSLGLDLLLIWVLLGPEALGLYAVGRNITTFPVLVLDALAANLVPRLAAATGDARRALEQHWLRISMAFALAMFVGLQLVIWPVLHYVFGAEFDAATTCSRLLILGLTLTGVRRVVQAVLQARGQGGAGSRVEGVVSVLMLAGMALGAHLGGLDLATAALPVASGLGLLWLLAHLSRQDLPQQETLGSVRAS